MTDIEGVEIHCPEVSPYALLCFRSVDVDEHGVAQVVVDREWLASISTSLGHWAKHR